ncbi:RNA:NAD 2'-phosphotransferase [Richelia intracellularis]|nr:RNA:NAD 2'-phosphotransferase [Richelia intracellularis]
MDRSRLIKISKYLSKYLRHQPERIVITLAPGGWVLVD